MCVIVYVVVVCVFQQDYVVRVFVRCLSAMLLVFLVCNVCDRMCVCVCVCIGIKLYIPAVCVCLCVCVSVPVCLY